MENISLKMEKALREEIEKVMKTHYYSTKTEFIREAIREKIKKLEEKDTIRPNLKTKEETPKQIPSYI